MVAFAGISSLFDATNDLPQEDTFRLPQKKISVYSVSSVGDYFDFGKLK